MIEKITSPVGLLIVSVILIAIILMAIFKKLKLSKKQVSNSNIDWVDVYQKLNSICMENKLPCVSVILCHSKDLPIERKEVNYPDLKEDEETKLIETRNFGCNYSVEAGFSIYSTHCHEDGNFVLAFEKLMQCFRRLNKKGLVMAPTLFGIMPEQSDDIKITNNVYCCVSYVANQFSGFIGFYYCGSTIDDISNELTADITQSISCLFIAIRDLESTVCSETDIAITIEQLYTLILSAYTKHQISLMQMLLLMLKGSNSIERGLSLLQRGDIARENLSPKIQQLFVPLLAIKSCHHLVKNQKYSVHDKKLTSNKTWLLGVIGIIFLFYAGAAIYVAQSVKAFNERLPDWSTALKDKALSPVLVSGQYEEKKQSYASIPFLHLFTIHPKNKHLDSIYAQYLLRAIWLPHFEQSTNYLQKIILISLLATNIQKNLTEDDYRLMESLSGLSLHEIFFINKIANESILNEFNISIDFFSKPDLIYSYKLGFTIVDVVNNYLLKSNDLGIIDYPSTLAEYLRTYAIREHEACLINKLYKAGITNAFVKIQPGISVYIAEKVKTLESQLAGVCKQATGGLNNPVFSRKFKPEDALYLSKTITDFTIEIDTLRQALDVDALDAKTKSLLMKGFLTDYLQSYSTAISEFNFDKSKIYDNPDANPSESINAVIGSSYDDLHVTIPNRYTKKFLTANVLPTVKKAKDISNQLEAYGVNKVIWDNAITEYERQYSKNYKNVYKDLMTKLVLISKAEGLKILGNDDSQFWMVIEAIRHNLNIPELKILPGDLTNDIIKISNSSNMNLLDQSYLSNYRSVLKSMQNSIQVNNCQPVYNSLLKISGGSNLTTLLNGIKNADDSDLSKALYNPFDEMKGKALLCIFKSINNSWQSNITPQLAKLQASFPFSDSKHDYQPDELKENFGPNGSVFLKMKNILSPYIEKNMASNDYQLNVKQKLNPDIILDIINDIRSFNAINHLNNLLFNGDGSFKTINLTVAPENDYSNISSDSDVVNLLEINGKEFIFIKTNHPLVAHFKYHFDSLKPISLSLLVDGNKSSQILFDEPWALEKMLANGADMCAERGDVCTWKIGSSLAMTQKKQGEAAISLSISPHILKAIRDIIASMPKAKEDGGTE